MLCCMGLSPIHKLLLAPWLLQGVPHGESACPLDNVCCVPHAQLPCLPVGSLGEALHLLQSKLAVMVPAAVRSSVNFSAQVSSL
jgi:hypothetical protein